MIEFGGGLFGVAWAAALVICATIAGKNQERPHRMWICRVPYASEEIWSDDLKRYQYHYPDMSCGKCGHPAPCRGTGRGH